MDAIRDDVGNVRRNIKDLLYSDYGTYREVKKECESLQLIQTTTTIKSRWNKSMVIVGVLKTKELYGSKYKHDKEEIGKT